MNVVYCILAVVAVVNTGLTIVYMRKWKAYTRSLTNKMTLKAVGV